MRFVFDYLACCYDVYVFVVCCGRQVPIGIFLASVVLCGVLLSECRFLSLFLSLFCDVSISVGAQFSYIKAPHKKNHFQNELRKNISLQYFRPLSIDTNTKHSHQRNKTAASLKAHTTQFILGHHPQNASSHRAGVTRRTTSLHGVLMAHNNKQYSRQ